MTLGINGSQHNDNRYVCCFAECRYAERRNYLIVMLSVFMLNVVMLRIDILSLYKFLKLN
jgi:hypothetical protein